MNPFLGRLLINLALGSAAAGAVLAFSGGRHPSEKVRTWVRRCALGFTVAIAAANAVMVYALLTHDFSVSYVAHVGSLESPTWVTVVSLWSSLEGSILFWGLMLGLYIAGASYALRNRHPEYINYATGVWLACAAFFAFLIAGPAQPFLTLANPPVNGPGPNPLLQNHILMVVHPPFLYAGYVGMTIPFGLAWAALMVGHLGHDFLRPLRTWLLLPWIFLTVAIALGGWWSYEVLGWGGYWAWDPVENASLLPWLTATAALHSAMLTERKGILKGWTVTLVMATFLLTVLGTFMTRSGVFNSVHSFTQSAIGPTILVFLGIAAAASIILLAMRIDALEPDAELRGTRSRDAMMLINNLLFVLLTFTVLLGTVFPLLMEAIQGKQMSVGRPYFDSMAVPLGAALLFLMGIGPALPWGSASRQEVRRALLPPLLSGTVVTLAGLALGVRDAWTAVILFAAGYACQVTFRELLLPMRQWMRGRGEGLWKALVEGGWRRGRRRLGGYIIHLGMLVVFVAVAVSSTMSTSKEVQLEAGQSTTVGAYTVAFQRAENVQEPNRQSLVAHLAISRHGKSLGELDPKMNFYPAQREPVGTPAVRSTLSGDLYLSLMNVSEDNRSIGLLVMHKPLVGWIWAAVLVMAIGGFIAILPRRRPAVLRAHARLPEAPGAGARSR